MERDSKREENRKRMPNVAALLDDLREQFGDFKVLAVEDYETGVKAGTFGESDNDEQ